MKTLNHPPLAKGQVWRTQAAAIEILGLGKRLIHYRVTRLFGRQRASVQISASAAMLNYLRTNRAQLSRAVAAGC